MAGLHLVQESEWGQIPAKLLSCSEGRWWAPRCPSWVFVLVSFTGVVLLSINNHWSRSCSWCLALSCPNCGLLLVCPGKLLLKEFGFVMTRKGEGCVSCREGGTAGFPCALGAAIWATLCSGPDAEGTTGSILQLLGVPLGVWCLQPARGCPLVPELGAELGAVLGQAGPAGLCSPRDEPCRVSGVWSASCSRSVSHCCTWILIYTVFKPRAGRVPLRLQQLQLLLNPLTSAGAEGGVNFLAPSSIPDHLVEKVQVWLQW